MSQVSLEGRRSSVYIYTVYMYMFIQYTRTLGVYIYELWLGLLQVCIYIYIYIYILSSYFCRVVFSKGRRRRRCRCRAPKSIKSSVGVYVVYVAGVASRGVLYRVGSQ